MSDDVTWRVLLGVPIGYVANWLWHRARGWVRWYMRRPQLPRAVARRRNGRPTER